MNLDVVDIRSLLDRHCGADGAGLGEFGAVWEDEFLAYVGDVVADAISSNCLTGVSYITYEGSI